MKDSLDLSIVIPFHNEEESLKVLIPSLFYELKKLAKTFEVILVNDCSTDGSFGLAKEFSRTYPQLVVLELGERGGQSGAYKLAFSKVRGEHTIRMDADLQDDPKDLFRFVEKIDQGADLIIGLREARKHNRWVRFAGLIYDMIILLLFNSPLHSNTGSYVCFRTKYIMNIPFRKNDHRYIPLIVMRRGAEIISEVFVRHNSRQFGQSKYNTYRKLILGIPEVFRFLYRYTMGYYDFPNQ